MHLWGNRFQQCKPFPKSHHLSILDMYLQPFQRSKMELFAKIVNGWKFDRVLNMILNLLTTQKNEVFL